MRRAAMPLGRSLGIAAALAAVLVPSCTSKNQYPAPDCCSVSRDAGVAKTDAGAIRDAGKTGTSHDSGGGDVTHDASQPDVSHSGADGGACVVCGRDWSANPPIAEVDGIDELWALSDIHADYKAATKLLTAAHLLAAVPSAATDAEWGGGSAVLVIVGDAIDKGPDAPDVLNLIIALQASAAVKGGRVIMTMGNHEAEFLANPESSSATASNGIDSQLQAAGLGIDATAGGKDAIGAFLEDLPIAARVGDWFFVHAGNTGGATIADLTSQIESGVDAAGFTANVLLGADSMLEARLSGSPPQWWDATGNATTLLTTWTAALSAKHLVMGHQPGSVGISDGPDRPSATMAAEYGGLLFLIDTGMSVDVDNTGGALLHVTNVGASTEAWEEVLPSGATKAL